MQSKALAKRNWSVQYTEAGVGLVNFTATAEITKFPNQHPYFSLTCWYKGINLRSHFEGGGADHELIVENFPALQPFVKWHLFSTDGPLHYIANSLYWAGFSGWCNGKPGDPPNFEYLKSTCVYGALPDDQDYCLSDMDGGTLRTWLEGRLDRLIDRFLEDMRRLFPDWRA